MASETMTREQIYEEFRAGNTDESNFGAVLVAEMADEIIRLRTTARTGAEQRFVCGGTPTPEGQKELDDFATYLRVKGRVEKQKGTGAGGGRVTVSDAMVEAAARTLAKKFAVQCGHDERDVWAIYGNDYRDDAREAITAALAASARGAAS